MEAGAYAKELVVESPDASMTKFKIPKDASGKEIHLILEVSDNNEIASLYDYRRIIITVE
jgi:hypothetical protein